METDRTLIKRSKFGLGELLSSVGGLYSALFAIGWGLAVLFGHWNMQAKLVSRLYEPKAKINKSAKGLIEQSLFKWNKSQVLERIEIPKCVQF